MPAKRIDFSCPKCQGGRDTTTIKYIEVNDYLQCLCTICGYEWRKDPADQDPPIPDGDSDVTE